MPSLKEINVECFVTKATNFCLQSQQDCETISKRNTKERVTSMIICRRLISLISSICKARVILVSLVRGGGRDLPLWMANRIKLIPWVAEVDTLVVAISTAKENSWCFSGDVRQLVSSFCEGVCVWCLQNMEIFSLILFWNRREQESR